MKRIAKLNARTPRNIQKVLRFLGVNNLNEARRQLGGRFVEGRRIYADRTLFTRLKGIYNEGVNAHQQGVQRQVRGELLEPEDRFNLLRSLKDIFERSRGKRISVIITQSEEYDEVLPPQSIPNLRGKRWKEWFYSVQNSLSLRLYHIARNRAEQEKEDDFQAKISFTEYVDIPSERLLQIFAHNRTQTCLLDPIEEWINGMKEGKHKETYRRKIAKYKAKYPTGVPETDLQSIADNLAIGINIDIPFGNEPFIRIRSKCKSTQKKTFKYLNVCENHVVYNKTFDRKFSLTGTPIYVSQQELNKMVRSSTTDGEVWWFQGRDGIHKVIKNDTIYMYDDPYFNAVEDFKKLYNIRLIEFDLLENPTLTNFLYDSIHQITHYDYHVDFDNKVKKIDQVKAYASAWKHTNFYEGFIGKITDFRKASKLDGIGFYYVEKFFNLPSFLQDKIEDKVVYASPMLRYLQSKGVSFTITHKAVGTKFDFHGFPEEMIEKKYYQKYIGQIQHATTHNRVYFNGSVKYGCHLQYCLNNTDIAMFEYRTDEYHEMTKNTHYKMNQYMIEYKREKDYGCPQFASFLIAYQNISMLEQLEMMETSKICRVAVDGIYYKDHDFTLHSAFRKEADTYIPEDCVTGATFFSRMEAREPPNITAGERDHHETELWIGAGGMGKTYSHMTDTGFINIMYLAPDHDVRADKEAEFGKPTFCYQLILKNDIHSEKLRNIRSKYNVVIVDECSKLNNKIKFELLQKLQGMKIIFLGDIREHGSYQLPPLEGRTMDFSGFDFVGKFEGVNRRFKDSKQLEIANHLRHMEELGLSAEEKMKYALTMYENVDKQYVIDNYKPTDTMLCSLHEIKDSWTECLKGEKYRCIYSRNGHFVGQVSYEKGCATDWEYQHGFTIHSVEGKTIEDTLYIDIRNFFQPQMLYTAISRARYSSQIKLVVGEEPLKFCDGFIYKIVSSSMKECYVGSTFDTTERWKDHLKGNNTASKSILSAGDAKMEIVWQGRVPYRIINGKRYSKTLLSKEDEFIKSCETVNQKLNVA